MRLCSLLFVILCVSAVCWADKPCLPRLTNNSVVCVCTADYCDTTTRGVPTKWKFYTYVSTEAGLRFHKSLLELDRNSQNSYITRLELDPSTRYQTINGFGGAVTDAAGINWKNLSDPRLMQHLIDSYCGETGLEYNMLRVPIGGSDFSTHPYTYNDSPVGDTLLSNFSLSSQDYEFKLPMIKSCMAASRSPVHIAAATWSPPIWMKTNNHISGHGFLKKEYFQTYADYHYKFIEKYSEEGVPIWAISTGNEPLDGTFAYTAINDLGWVLPNLAEWVTKYLGPTIRNSTFKDIKIMAVDDQRYSITLFWNVFLMLYPETLQYFDGVGVHFYTDKMCPPSILSKAMENHPDKFILVTEACTGAFPTEYPKVDLGSWSRGETYLTNIMENLSYNVIGWIDWNLCLNSEGGPNWVNNFVDSPIIVNPEAGEFYKQPMFYAVGHFSKFVPRGSQRIKITTVGESKVTSIAFITPNNTIVTVLYNGSGEKETIGIQLGDNTAVVHVEKKSFTTVEMLYD